MIVPIWVIVGKTKGFPFGADGILDLSYGDYSISGGEIKDYESINIPAGRTLTITGSDPVWTKIGCKKDFILQGSIILARATPGIISPIIDPEDPLLEIEELTYNNEYGSPGGAGGRGGDSNNGTYYKSGGAGGAGGTLSSGHGGGGGGGGRSTNLSSTWSGNLSSNGSPGQSGDSGGAGGGNGGTGADPGLNGKGLYIKCKGNFIGTGGIIDLSGGTTSSATNGGNYSTGSFSSVNAPGGGGGGGCGGRGGKLVVRYGKTYDPPTINATGGARGAAGSAGSGTGPGKQNGSVAPSVTGADGEIDISTL